MMTIPAPSKKSVEHQTLSRTPGVEYCDSGGSGGGGGGGGGGGRDWISVRPPICHLEGGLFDLVFIVLGKHP